MSRAILFAAVSLDGFVADEHDQVGPLFDWYGNGGVAGPVSDAERVFHPTAATAEFLYELAPRMATMVCGRRLFALPNGWGGRPPKGAGGLARAPPWPPAGGCTPPRRAGAARRPTASTSSSSPTAR